MSSSSDGCQRSATRRLLRQAVEGLAVLGGEALGELVILRGPRVSRLCQSRAQRAEVFFVEPVALAQLAAGVGLSGRAGQPAVAPGRLAAVA
jgi:hypothetical protein